MQTKVSFTYDEETRKWEVFVTGVTNEIEALQAFNAVVISCGSVIPSIAANKATMVNNDETTYKISIGV